MKKKLLVAGTIILCAAIGIGVVLYGSMDAVLASVIRSYGPQVTGVSVKLGSVKISPSEGTASLAGLVVGNPEGFKTKSALSLGKISVKLDMSSLGSDVIVIREISIDAPEVTYEYASGGSNLDVIAANVKRNAGGEGGGGKPASDEPGKKLVIDDLYIRNGKVNVSAAILEGREMTMPLPEIHLQGIGKKSGGATAGETVRQVMDAISGGAANAVSSIDFGGAANKLKEGAGEAADKLKGFFR